MLTTNILFIFVFFRYFPNVAIFGPAVGIVMANVVQTVFYGWRITNLYDVPVKRLLKWRSLAIIALSTLFASLPLLAGEFVAMSDFVRVPTFSILFATFYYLAIRSFRLEEVETLIQTVMTKFAEYAK